jgi:hypothetical protein
MIEGGKWKSIYTYVVEEEDIPQQFATKTGKLSCNSGNNSLEATLNLKLI